MATIELFSTEALTAAAAGSPIPGAFIHHAQAAQLLKLDTIERRKRANAEAITRTNLIGGIPSQHLAGAAADILDNAARGNEAEELYGERTAREYRERETELRRITGNNSAIYYPSR